MTIDISIPRTTTPRLHSRSRIRIVTDSEGVDRVVAEPEEPPPCPVVEVDEFEWPEGSEQ